MTTSVITVWGTVISTASPQTLTPDAMAASYTAWLATLPLAPQVIPGWWNNSGMAVFS